MSKFNDQEEDDLINFEPDDFDDCDIMNVSDSKSSKKYDFSNSTFSDFALKPELLRAIIDCGFENPSDVQHLCITQALLGSDLICQAKSGMGKTVVFVLAVLQQLEMNNSETQCLVVTHTRELAYQICIEFNRFTKYMNKVKCAVFYGGIPLNVNLSLLNEKFSIIVGTPAPHLYFIQLDYLYN